MRKARKHENRTRARRPESPAVDVSSARATREARRQTVLRDQGRGPFSRWSRPVRWIPVVLLLGSGITLVRWREARAAAPVAPADLDAVDPELRPILERELASAARSPSSARGHGTLGLLYEANLMWSEAERSFANAAQLQASQPLWSVHRAVALRELGDFEAALALLRNALDGDRRCAAAWFHLGDLLMEIGRIDEGVDCLESAAALAETVPEAHAGLGGALLRRKDFSGAARQLEMALAQDPEYRSAHHLLGLAYRGLGRTEAALRELSLGQGAERRSFPDALSDRTPGFRVDFASQIARSVQLLRTGKGAEAIRILEGLQARRPEDMAVVNNLAIAYQKSGQIGRATHLLEQAKKRDPATFSTWVNLASCLLDQGKLDEARTHAERAIALAPEIGTNHLMLGQVLLRQGALARAYEELKTAVRLDARNPDAHVLLGEVSFGLERKEEARASLEAALRIAPDHVGAHIDLGRVLVGLGRLDAAERELAAARKLAPNERLVEMLARLIAAQRTRR